MRKEKGRIVYRKEGKAKTGKLIGARAAGYMEVQ